MRLPALGALGCMSVEGFSLSEERQVSQVTSTMPASATPNTARASQGLNPSCRPGSRYMVAYARQKMDGSRLNPNSTPTTQPISVARQQ